MPYLVFISENVFGRASPQEMRQSLFLKFLLAPRIFKFRAAFFATHYVNNEGGYPISHMLPKPIAEVRTRACVFVGLQKREKTLNYIARQAISPQQTVNTHTHTTNWRPNFPIHEHFLRIFHWIF